MIRSQRYILPQSVPKTPDEKEKKQEGTQRKTRQAKRQAAMSVYLKMIHNTC